MHNFVRNVLNATLYDTRKNRIGSLECRRLEWYERYGVRYFIFRLTTLATALTGIEPRSPMRRGPTAVRDGLGWPGMARDRTPLIRSAAWPRCRGLASGRPPGASGLSRWPGRLSHRSACSAQSGLRQRRRALENVCLLCTAALVGAFRVDPGETGCK